MYHGRKSETKVQFTFETKKEFWKNEFRRAHGKILSYLWFKFKWKFFPKFKLVAPFPLNVDIEVSSSCNLKCDHCFRQYMDIKENGLMSLEMYKKIVDECGKHKLFTLKFSMRGEPTLHPDLPEMVAYAKDKGIKEIWINTHGGNITEDLAVGLMQAKPDWITMSFDGLDEMYESIRKPLRYQESFEKLKILRKARDKYAPYTMLNVQTLWSAIKDDPDKYRKTMREVVDRVAFNSDMNFKEIMLVPDPDFICPRLWQRLVITSEGDVLKCPSDFEKDEVLGNVREKSIKEIWDNEQKSNRAAHVAGKKNDSVPCKKCHHGAKKVKREVNVADDNIDCFNFEFEKEFSGVGLNRSKK